MDTAAALAAVAALAACLPADGRAALLAAVERYGDLRADEATAELTAPARAA